MLRLSPVPVELMEIDTRYQTEAKTERDLRYLTNKMIILEDKATETMEKIRKKYGFEYTANLEMKTAVTSYVEDLVVENLGLEQSREISGTRLVPIKKGNRIIT